MCGTNHTDSTDNTNQYRQQQQQHHQQQQRQHQGHKQQHQHQQQQVGAAEQMMGLNGASDSPRRNQRESDPTAARLLGLKSSQVVMYVPGQGVRPYPFSRVFDGKCEQDKVYDLCAR